MIKLFKNQIFCCGMVAFSLSLGLLLYFLGGCSGSHFIAGHIPATIVLIFFVVMLIKLTFKYGLQPIIKRQRIAISVIIISAMLLASYVLVFSGGFSGLYFLVGIMPAGMIPIFSAFIFTVLVFKNGVQSINKRQRIVLSVIIIIVTLSFWRVPKLFPHSLFLVGFKYRILKISSPQELREIAANARKILVKQRNLPSPDKTWLWEENIHRSLWEQMPNYKILSDNDHYVSISVSDSNSVDIIWGGALTGHHGIRIGEGNTKKIESDFEFFLIDKDIAIFASR
jgi:hypothetical protein